MSWILSAIGYFAPILFVGVALFVLGMAFVYYMAYKGRWGFDRFLRGYPSYRLSVKNPKAMDKIIPEIEHLTFEEKAAVLERLFQRPIRIVLGVDRSGCAWLEAVAPFSPTDETDEAFHVEELVKDKKPTGIG